MRRISGRIVSRGIAKGRILLSGVGNFQLEIPAGADRHTDDPEAEMRAFYSAREQIKSELEALYNKTLKTCGEEEAMIFRAHSLLLMDKSFEESVRVLIADEKLSALYAVHLAGKKIASVFSEMEDEYMRDREDDIWSVAKQLVLKLDPTQSDLEDESELTGGADEKLIIIGDDITPSRLMSMDRERVAGMVARTGSELSHTAILARSLGVPALVQVDIERLCSGEYAIIDAIGGELIVDPEAEDEREYAKLVRKEEQRLFDLESLKGLSDSTQSGRKLRVCANIGDYNDLRTALDNDAAGIGLFRTECLFFAGKKLPDEDEQLEMYKKMLIAAKGKKFCLRTLDIGSDKQLRYLRTAHEDNPALGIRGIRFCLLNEDIFLTQLRAVLRAARYGNMQIMYPMITDVSEWESIQKLLLQARGQLDEKGVAYGPLRQGIMIETPAAALISDELAERVDFFSIGTNDLTQYTLALDRNESGLDRFYNAYHPAIESLIRRVVQNAKKAGIPVAVCGETATDKRHLDLYLETGVDEVSVSPSMILEVRKMIRDSK